MQAAFLGELCFVSIDQAQVETHTYFVHSVLALVSKEIHNHRLMIVSSQISLLAAIHPAGK